MNAQRVGLGFDLHPWSEDRPLLLGGVRFADELGLGGHSDGDVVCHALADALLGAAALGDLGQHFPETNPVFAGIGGLDLLGRVGSLLAASGLEPVRFDLTLIAERPHISARREEMRARLAGALGLPVDAASVKATRPEGLGLSGEGAGCLAIATISQAPVGRAPDGAESLSG